MAISVGTAFVDIRADLGGLSRTINSQIKPEMDRVSKNIRQSVGGALRSSAALGASAIATAGLAAFLRSAVNEAREAARVSRQTAAVIKSTGGAANVSADQVDKLSSALSKTAAVDDEVVAGAANLLLTFTNIRNEVGKGNDIFDQATATVLDMSAALGQDTSSSAIQLGKALQDPIKGITALRRVGVAFTAQQQEQIKTLVESGRTLEAQKIIIGELGREFGGAAEAAADPTARLAVAFGELQESVGTALAPALNDIAGGATKVANVFSGLPQPIQTASVVLLGLTAVSPILVRVADAAGRLHFKLLDIATSGSGAGNALLGLGTRGAAIARAGAGIAALGVGVGLLVEKLTDPTVRGGGAVTEAVAALAESGTEAAPLLKQVGIDIDDLASTLDSASQHGGMWTSLGEINLGDVRQAHSDLDNLDRTLVEMVQGGHLDQARAAFDNLWAAAEAQGVDRESFVNAFDDYRDSLAGARAEAALAPEASEQVVNGFDLIAEGGEEATAALDGLAKGFDEVFGRFFTVEEATSAYEASLDDLNKSLFTNGATIDLNTEAGRANSDALRTLVSDGQALLLAQVQQGFGADALNLSMQRLKDEYIRNAVAAGRSRQEATLLADQLFTVESIDPTVHFSTSNLEGVRGDIQAIVGDINAARVSLGLPVLTASSERLAAGLLGTGVALPRARGGILDFFGLGGVRDRANAHTAEIAPAGAMRVWAEPETGGEAYIPLANDSRRNRAKSVFLETGRRLGFAPGGLALLKGATQHALGSVSGGRVNIDFSSPEIRAALLDLAERGVRGGALTGPGGGNIVKVGRQIQGMGFRVSEHPAFGGVARGAHVANSKHYVGRALDINWPGGGEMGRLDKLAGWIRANVKGISQMLWRVSGHFNHLHLAMARGGIVEPYANGGVVDPVQMADGGIVRARPGGITAQLGEGRHDEAVVPLSDEVRRHMGGLHIENLNVPNPRASARDVVEEVAWFVRTAGV